VELGDGCQIGPRCTLAGPLRMGAGCVVHSGASIGDLPQDYSYRPCDSATEIGEGAIIREYVTIHRGNAPGTVTRIGAHGMLMTFTHIAHNCQIGDRVTMANFCQLAGHVQVADKATLSALVHIHQFCRIGTGAMISANARLPQDVPPWALVNEKAEIVGPNAIGLRRGGYEPAVRDALRTAFRRYCYGSQRRSLVLDELAVQFAGIAEIEHFIAFIRASKRGVLSGVSGGAPDASETP
jgi:UDP-N-acetylglucosamine acyltransferase